MVEADNGCPGHMDTELLNLLQVGDHVTSHIVELPGFLQAFDVGALDTDKDIKEVGLDSEAEKIIVLGYVYGELGEEVDGLALPPIPVAYCLENLSGLLPVGREVVIGEANNVHVEPVYLFDLPHDRIYRLVAHRTPHIIDNVAELAVEGTAPARLNDPYGIPAPDTFTEVRVVRNGRDGQVEPLSFAVFPLVPAGQIIGDELGPNSLCLSNDEDVGIRSPTLRS